MKISKIKIRNFRLLHNVEMRLENGVTVVVGRNNCGKTSLSDVIRRFLADSSSFDLEDFSSASYDDFCAALRAKVKGASDAEVRALIPYIELRVLIEYDDNTVFGPLEDFVIDVDDTNHEAVVVCRRALRDGAISDLFAGYEKVALEGEDEALPIDARNNLFKSLRERVPTLFVTQLWAEDPSDPLNKKEVQASAVKGLLSCEFINAQRGLDGTSSRNSDILSKVLENLFANASLPTADAGQRDIATGLTKAVEEIQGTIDEDFRKQLTRLMPTIKSFGYPGLDGHELRTETHLDVKRLLSDHTKVQYSGYSGVNLPESYNGLGFRNLLFILLQMVGFYRSFQAKEHAPGLQLVFIEEPEAHLHPQMQEVFIRHLSTVAEKLCEQDGEGAYWPVQFVVSTHSSHVANEASFDAIRYFAVTSKDQPVGVRRTNIKDLSTGLSSQDAGDIAFLHQYLTLTRCDLFFADKVILIEGTTERLMVPQITQKLNAAHKNLNLTSQYITTMEVGGAYAHIFFPLLDLLDLRTLIVTDLDPVKAGKKNGRTCWKACSVHDSERTSNACLKSWFKSGDTNDEVIEEMEILGEDEPDDDGQIVAEADSPLLAAIQVSPTELIAKKNYEKIKGNRRIAYQVPENVGGPCGRTFEDAFILANAELFGIRNATADEQAVAAGKLAKKQKKSTFALTYAISKTEWTPPRYLVEGLKWLAEGNLAVLDPNLALVVEATAEIESVLVADVAATLDAIADELEGGEQ